MPGISSEINKLAFVIAPVFWHLVYRSVVAVFAGFAWLATGKIMKRYFGPRTRNMLFMYLLLSLVTLRLPQGMLSPMIYIEPIEDISYRYEYDIIQQQVHIAMETEADDMIDGLTDEQLLEKEKQIYYKSLVFDVALPLTWVTGVSAVAVWLLLSALKLNKNIKMSGSMADERILTVFEDCKKQLSMKNNIKIIITDHTAVPAATGLFRKKILLPAYVQTMDDENVRYIILHELCHIKEYHLSSIYISIILQIVYWFNPLVQYLFSVHRQNLELMTDISVVKATGQPKKYAAAMVEVLANNNHIGFDSRMLCMADSVKNMKQRIENIKNIDFLEKHDIGITRLAIIMGTVVYRLFMPTSNVEANYPTEYSTGIYYGVHPLEIESWVNTEIIIDGEKVFSVFPESDVPVGKEITVNCMLPENWTMTTEGGYTTRSGLPLPLGEFSTTMNITDGEHLIGYIGISSFEPYTGEIPPEKYHETVWPVLRLGSFRAWDDFEQVKRTTSGESGTVKIWYVDHSNIDKYGSNAASPHYQTNGVLAYDKEKQVYIGFGFVPATVADKTAQNIARNIEFK